MRGTTGRESGLRSASSRLAASAIAIALAVACTDVVEDPTPNRVDVSGPLSVYVVNHPLEYFTKRIGGAHVEVVFPAPRDVDPASWMPPPEIIGAFQEADLIIENGAGYARWMERASLPRARRVDTSTGFRDRWIALEGGVSHGHGPEGEHSHVGSAHTTWLDPTLAKEQARAIAHALVSLRPLARADFEAGLRGLEADLDALDRRLARALEPFSKEPMLFSRPVYQYLARRYSLEGNSLDWEPGEMPDERKWSAFGRSVEQRPARILFFDGEPHAEATGRLSAMGIRIIVFETVGNRPEQGDWLSAMHLNIERLVAPAAPGATPGEQVDRQGTSLFRPSPLSIFSEGATTE